ncbi:hypothetical protein OSTOST_00556 [Ostertagia ostertagi]
MHQCEHRYLQEFIESQVSFQYRMQEIENGVVYVNKIEDTLKTLANLLSVDLHVYRRIDDEPDVYRGSEGESPEKVLLCETSGGHFDLVITKEDHDSLALAQSLVYDALCSGVVGFSRDAINESIEKLRKRIDAIRLGDKTPTSDNMEVQYGEISVSDENKAPSDSACGSSIPLSSVRALDPTIYRNLALELYDENNVQGGDSDAFQPGSHCILMDGDSFDLACVQSAPDKDSRVILVNGTEKQVDVSKLLPLPMNEGLPCCSTSIDTDHTDI